MNYHWVLLNTMMCGAIMVVCICRLSVMHTGIRKLVRLKYTLLLSGACAYGFQPFIFGTWPTPAGMWDVDLTIDAGQPADGDSVTVIKDLKVKGSSQSVKVGTTIMVLAGKGEDAASVKSAKPAEGARSDAGVVVTGPPG